MLGVVLEQELAWCEEDAAGVIACLHGFGDRRERGVGALELSHVESHVGKYLQRRVEQDELLDEVGATSSELGSETAAETVPEPHSRRLSNGLEDVCEVRRGVPWRLSAREAVPAQVGRETVKRKTLREPPEPAAV
jgi:hypothetical protein